MNHTNLHSSNLITFHLKINYFNPYPIAAEGMGVDSEFTELHPLNHAFDYSPAFWRGSGLNLFTLNQIEIPANFNAIPIHGKNASLVSECAEACALSLMTLRQDREPFTDHHDSVISIPHSRMHNGTAIHLRLVWIFAKSREFEDAR